MYDLVIHSDGPMSGELLDIFWDDLVSVTSGSRKNADGTYLEEVGHYTRFRFKGDIWRNTDAHAQAAKRGYLVHVEPV